MARSLSLFSKSLSSKTLPFSLSALRFDSTLSSFPNPSSDDDSSADAHIRTLEDAIHRIIVRRSAPDWLPFIPGSSYWVPPTRSASGGIAQIVERLANPLSQEECLAATTVRGWPSSDYFMGGPAAPPLPGVKLTFVMEEESSSSNLPKSEEEEG